MIVYADVLVVLNIIVDYFLLRLTARLLKRNTSAWRMVFGAVLGGVSSLYIFLPQLNPLFEAAVRITFCIIISLTVFGFKSIKSFMRAVFIFVAITFGYGGAMTAVWYLFKPNGMVINNSVVYFNVSPLFLIGFSVIAYFIIMLCRGVSERNNIYSKKCTISVFADGNNTELTAIVDTGNSIEDMFSKSEVIVADKKVFYSLFEDFPTGEALKKRYRVLPIDTVSGEALLDGYRCDKALVRYGNKNIMLERPVLAVSKATLDDGYNAIINPRVLE